MNVLIVVPWDQEYGGVASVVGNLAKQLCNRSHSVFFFHPAHNNRIQKKVTKWGFPGFEGALHAPISGHLKSWLGVVAHCLSTLHQLVRILTEYRIQVVNIHYP